MLLLNLQPRTYVLAMGAALVVYGLYMLFRRPVLIKSGPRHAVDALVGLWAESLAHWQRSLAPVSRSGAPCADGTKSSKGRSSRPYILLMQLIGVGTLFLLQPRGTFDPALLAYALPGLAGAIFGLRVFHALTDLQFQRMINLALVVSGSALLFK